MLTVPSILRTIIPEQGTHREQLHRLCQDGHTMLNIGTTQSCCHLRTQCDFIAASSRKGIYLLIDDIRPLPDAPKIEVRKFNQRQIDTLKTVFLLGMCQHPTNPFPVRLLIRQDIPHSPKCLKQDFFLALHRLIRLLDRLGSCDFLRWLCR